MEFAEPTLRGLLATRARDWALSRLHPPHPQFEAFFGDLLADRCLVAQEDLKLFLPEER